jgi:hypothetical protein
MDVARTGEPLADDVLDRAQVLTDEERVAVHAQVDGRAVGAFYDLQQGRIAAGIEIWA